MSAPSKFTALPNAVVPIRSISELKRYMLRVRPTARGLPVDQYGTNGDELRARLVYPDGSKAWIFSGYLEDVAYNAQRGFYEEEATWP